MTALDPVFRIGDQIAGDDPDPRTGRPAPLVSVPRSCSTGLASPARTAGFRPIPISCREDAPAVMIAIAIVSRPAVLIADEPTTALDVTIRRRSSSCCDRISNDHGTAILMITHDLGSSPSRAVECTRCTPVRSSRSARSTRRARPWHPYGRGSSGRSARRSTWSDPLLDPGRSGAVGDAGRMSVPAALRSCRRRLCRGAGVAAVRWPERPVRPPCRARARGRGRATTTTSSMSTTEPLLTVSGLEVHYRLPGTRTPLRAVDDVSFHIGRGEIFGLIGESDSGQSSVARAVMRLAPVSRGAITLGAERIDQLRGKRLRTERRRIQMVFQDPSESLDPRMTIRQSVAEPLQFGPPLSQQAAAERVVALIQRSVSTVSSITSRTCCRAGRSGRSTWPGHGTSTGLLICDEAVRRSTCRCRPGSSTS